jgi:hypothetical protein
VLPLSVLNRLTLRAALLLAFTVVSAVLLLTASVPPDEPLSDSVGAIDGEAISVTGPMSVEVVHGQVKTVLRSGSDVRVKSGTARIDLIEGGQISICGPAHLSVLKSGTSLTVALDTGSIHVHIERLPALTIYTPQIQAQSVTIGDGPQDVVAGFDAQGAMCLRANRGAIRAEQQLTGQSVLIPQAGDVLIVNGQLNSLTTGPGHCACELQIAKTPPPPQPEINQLTASEGPPKDTVVVATSDSSPAPLNPSTTREEPIYQVFMPPLIYDARAKVQPEVDPKLIVLVRRVRVRPTLIFQGRVEGETVAAAIPPTASAPATVQKPVPPANGSFMDRARSFVRKLWSRGS